MNGFYSFNLIKINLLIFPPTDKYPSKSYDNHTKSGILCSFSPSSASNSALNHHKSFGKNGY